MGAVLSQRNQPITFFSKPFPPKFLNASVYVRELFVITTVVKKWRQYLLGRCFTIITYHMSLKELLTQVIQTPKQHMYLARLMGYEYQIQYRTGIHNQATDELSRCFDSEGASLLSFFVPCPLFREELRRQLEANAKYLHL